MRCRARDVHLGLDTHARVHVAHHAHCARREGAYALSLWSPRRLPPLRLLHVTLTHTIPASEPLFSSRARMACDRSDSCPPFASQISAPTPLSVRRWISFCATLSCLPNRTRTRTQPRPHAQSFLVNFRSPAEFRAACPPLARPLTFSLPGRLRPHATHSFHGLYGAYSALVPYGASPCAASHRFISGPTACLRALSPAESSAG